MRKLRHLTFLCCAIGSALAAPAVAAPGDLALGPMVREEVPQSYRIVGDVAARSPHGDGMVAGWPVEPNMEIGVGRFTIADTARPSTNMEEKRNPCAMRDADRGIAAFGLRMHF